MDEITKKETAKIGAATRDELKNLGLELVEGKRFGNDTEVVTAKGKNGEERYLVLLLYRSDKTVYADPEEISSVIACCPTYGDALLVSSAVAMGHIMTGMFCEERRMK